MCACPRGALQCAIAFLAVDFQFPSYHDDLVPRVYFDNATGVCVEAVACVTIDPSSGDDRTVIREVRHNVCINVTRVGVRG